jgi:hypothetical protein
LCPSPLFGGFDFGSLVMRIKAYSETISKKMRREFASNLSSDATTYSLPKPCHSLFQRHFLIILAGGIVVGRHILLGLLVLFGLRA